MKRILLSVSVLVLAAASAAGATYAYFSSSVTSSSNTFTAGTLVLGNIPQTALISYSDIYPGWNYHDASHWGYDHLNDVVVKNNGSLPLKYRLIATPVSGTTVSDYALDNVLAAVYVDYGINGSSNHTQLYKGTLRGLFDYVVVDTDFDPSVSHSGWWGTGERVFIELAVPPTVGNEFQGQNVQFDLTFDATQVENPSW